MYVNTLPRGTFAAHFAGVVAGLISVYIPRLAGFGRLGGARAYSGRGNRLGGRTLREDDSAARGGRPDPRSMTTRAGGGQRQQQPQQGGGYVGTNGGRRLGDGSGGGGRGGGGGGGGGGWGGAGNAGKRVWRLLVSPLLMLKGAADEGAPLMVHGGFAVACIVLQQMMSRHLPEGVLSKALFNPRTWPVGSSF